MVTPNALLATQVGDLINTTLRDLGEMRFTEIATDLQFHTAMRNLLRKNRIQLESGTGLQWDLMIQHSGSAANVGLYASDNVNDIDVFIQGTADWRHSTCNYAIDGRVLAMNRTPRRIIDMLKAKRIAALISMAELMETNFWGPPVASTDNLTPFGVNMWIVKNATEGFNGGAPSGYTTVAGVSPTTYPRWQNWTFQYTSVSRDDFIRKCRNMATKTHFEPPVDGIPTFNTGDLLGYYANYNVIQPLEEALESQNDNLGTDVASMDGKVMFRRVPVMYVPKLDADTTNPFYQINWGVFKTWILRGWWLKETQVPIMPGQHTVSAQFVDCSYNWVLRDRRRCGVGATGTTYPT